MPCITFFLNSLFLQFTHLLGVRDHIFSTVPTGFPQSLQSALLVLIVPFSTLDIMDGHPVCAGQCRVRIQQS